MSNQEYAQKLGMIIDELEMLYKQVEDEIDIKGAHGYDTGCLYDKLDAMKAMYNTICTRAKEMGLLT